MKTELDPVVGNWYRHLDKGQQFCVVAIDTEAGTVELQHFDGDVEEVDLRAWKDMPLEICEAPEDWTGPVDDVEADDLPYSETGMDASGWQAPLQELAGPAEEPWEDTSAEDERDDWAEGVSVEELEPQQQIEDSAGESAGEETGAAGSKASGKKEKTGSGG